MLRGIYGNGKRIPDTEKRIADTRKRNNHYVFCIPNIITIKPPLLIIHVFCIECIDLAEKERIQTQVRPVSEKFCVK